MNVGCGLLKFYFCFKKTVICRFFNVYIINKFRKYLKHYIHYVHVITPKNKHLLVSHIGNVSVKIAICF